ncbi:hypothetical protein UlMin_003541 [Ulmus minor]
MAEIAHSIVEQREELMVSLNGAPKPISRIAHFLKSPQSSINQPSPQLSTQSLPKYLSLKGIFCGWRSPPKNWKTWVDLLMPKYESLWKKAGIFEAIRISTFQVPKNDILLLGISEKWNSESKSFIFPWGEATITLEDVMVLGGYSVLGSSVLSPLESSEMVEMEEKLRKARSIVGRGTCHKADQGAWIQLFMGRGNDFEHEAFLVAWLSRFVLPDSQLIRKDVFPIAIRLARGIRIALAPAILSSIYKDLSSLKTCKEDDLVIKLWSPFQLVHLWILGRFSAIQLQDNAAVFFGWQKVEKRRLESIRKSLDSDGKEFLWRPYVRNCSTFGCARVYGEEEMLVSIGSGLDEETESFARCLRVSKLVGLDSVEEYLPHRVARQFGFDQDVPGWLVLSDRTPKLAWEDYSKPIGGDKLYIPSRHFEGDVSIKYLKWQKSPLLDLIKLNKSASQQLGKLKMPKPIPEASIVNIEEEEEELRDVQPGPPPKHNSAKEKNHVKLIMGSNIIAAEWLKGIEESEKINHVDVPPGFSPKYNSVRENFYVRKTIGCSAMIEDDEAAVLPCFPPMSNSARNSSYKTSIGSKAMIEGNVDATNHPDVPPGFSPKHNSETENFYVRKSENKSSLSNAFQILGSKRSMAAENEGSGGNKDHSSKEENNQRKKPRNNEQSQKILVSDDSSFKNTDTRIEYSNDNNNIQSLACDESALQIEQDSSGASMIVENVEPSLPINDQVMENGEQGGANSDEVMLPGVAELHAQIDWFLQCCLSIKE